MSLKAFCLSTSFRSLVERKQFIAWLTNVKRRYTTDHESTTYFSTKRKQIWVQLTPTLDQYMFIRPKVRCSASEWATCSHTQLLSHTFLKKGKSRCSTKVPTVQDAFGHYQPTGQGDVDSYLILPATWLTMFVEIDLVTWKTTSNLTVFPVQLVPKHEVT